MSSFARIVAGLLAAAFITGGAMAATPEEMIKGAKGLDEAFLKAFNEHNAEAMGPLYWNSPETVLMPPDMMVAKGHAAIMASFAQMIATMKDCQLEMVESHNVPVGDVAVGWGLYKLTMAGPDGKPMEILGRYSDVKAERDGKWVYLVDHASVPTPPPPAPEAAPKQ